MKISVAIGKDTIVIGHRGGRVDVERLLDRAVKKLRDSHEVYWSPGVEGLRYGVIKDAAGRRLTGVLDALAEIVDGDRAGEILL